MDRKIVTKNSLETLKLGIEFAKELSAEDVVLLYGDLGTGKTTFVQGIAKGLNISDRIISPTFVLIRSHKIPYSSSKQSESRSSRQARTIMLNHIDLYRVEKPSEIKGLGLSEVVEEDDSITVIEWADKLSDFKPAKGYKIWFKYLEKDKREIVIEKLT